MSCCFFLISPIHTVLGKVERNDCITNFTNENLHLNIELSVGISDLLEFIKEGYDGFLTYFDENIYRTFFRTFESFKKLFFIFECNDI